MNQGFRGTFSQAKRLVNAVNNHLGNLPLEVNRIAPEFDKSLPVQTELAAGDGPLLRVYQDNGRQKFICLWHGREESWMGNVVIRAELEKKGFTLKPQGMP